MSSLRVYLPLRVTSDGIYVSIYSEIEVDFSSLHKRPSCRGGGCGGDGSSGNAVPGDPG